MMHHHIHARHIQLIETSLAAVASFFFLSLGDGGDAIWHGRRTEGEGCRNRTGDWERVRVSAGV